MRNWSWVFGQSSAIGRALNRPRLRARTDQRINLPVVVLFGVGIGVYTFQPALKEAAEIVKQEADAGNTQLAVPAADTLAANADKLRERD